MQWLGPGRFQDSSSFSSSLQAQARTQNSCYRVYVGIQSQERSKPVDIAAVHEEVAMDADQGQEQLLDKPRLVKRDNPALKCFPHLHRLALVRAGEAGQDSYASIFKCKAVYW